MGFPVLANELGGVDATEVKRLNLVQQPLDLCAFVACGALQLPLRNPLQEAASGFVGGFDVLVDQRQKLVGNGDHHLGHRVSIYGIARRQSGHAGKPGGSRRTCGAQNAPICANFGADLRF